MRNLENEFSRFSSGGKGGGGGGGGLEQQGLGPRNDVLTTCKAIR